MDCVCGTAAESSSSEIFWWMKKRETFPALQFQFSHFTNENRNCEEKIELILSTEMLIYCGSIFCGGVTDELESERREEPSSVEFWLFTVKKITQI